MRRGVVAKTVVTAGSAEDARRPRENTRRRSPINGAAVNRSVVNARPKFVRAVWRFQQRFIHWFTVVLVIVGW